MVLSGRREVLVEVIGHTRATEVEDREALDVPTATYDVFLTSKELHGRTLEDIVQTAEDVRGVFLLGITRRGQQIPVAPRTVIQRADVLRLSGPESAVRRVAAAIGDLVTASDETDFVALGCPSTRSGCRTIPRRLPRDRGMCELREHQ